MLAGISKTEALIRLRRLLEADSAFQRDEEIVRERFMDAAKDALQSMTEEPCSDDEIFDALKLEDPEFPKEGE